MKRGLIFGRTGHMGLTLKRHLDPARYQITVVTETRNRLATSSGTVATWEPGRKRSTAAMWDLSSSFQNSTPR